MALKPLEKPNLSEAVERGMRRAAELARKVAKQTGTKLVVVKDGKIVHIDP